MSVHSIAQIGSVAQALSPPNAITKGGTQTPSFSEVMIDVIRSTNQEVSAADQAVTDFVSGKTDDLESVVMATVNADLSFRFLLEMRNRVTESYQELSRMQF